MSSRVRLASEAGWNDPTLAVDGLSEFLPSQPDPEDPTLAVNALDEFFADQPTAAREPVEEDRAASDPALDAGGLEDYFRTRDNAAIPDCDDPAREHDVDDMQCSIETAELGFMSETQRVALEFQLFAEKFHAFAAECEHR